MITLRLARHLASALVCSVVLGGSALAQDNEATGATETFYPDPGNALDRFRWYGEEITYVIRILGTEAVRARISVGYISHDEEYGTVIPFEIVGTTVGFFDTIYHIDNRSITLLRLPDLFPIFTDSDFNERDYVTRLVVDYDRDAYHHSVLRIAPDEPPRTDESIVPHEVYDDVGMIFDSRGRDLAVGRSFIYYSHDGDVLARFTLTVTGTEDVYTEDGYVECFVISWVVEMLETAPALVFGGPSPPTFRAIADPDEVAISYVAVDEGRLLIGTDVKTDIGLMTIRAVDWKPPNPDYSPQWTPSTEPGATR